MKIFNISLPILIAVELIFAFANGWNPFYRYAIIVTASLLLLSVIIKIIYGGSKND